MLMWCNAMATKEKNGATGFMPIDLEGDDIPPLKKDNLEEVWSSMCDKMVAKEQWTAGTKRTPKSPKCKMNQ